MSEENTTEDELKLNTQEYKFFKPFRIVRVGRFHLWWLVFIIFLGILLDFLPIIFTKNYQRIREIISNGALYSVSMALCIPFISELALSMLTDDHRNIKSNFQNYKLISMLIDIVLAIIISACWLGVYKGNLCLQIISASVSVSFGFYIHCVLLMDTYEPYQIFEEDYFDRIQKGAKKTKRKLHDVGTMEGVKYK